MMPAEISGREEKLPEYMPKKIAEYHHWCCWAWCHRFSFGFDARGFWSKTLCGGSKGIPEHVRKTAFQIWGKSAMPFYLPVI